MAMARDERTVSGPPAELDELIDGELVQISRRIRRWREEKGFTLQQLAERSDLATSTVQKVETGQMIPSVAVLLKVARGLGRRPTELIREDDEARRVDVELLRRRDRSQLGDSRRLTIERLSGDLSDPALEMWRVTLRPNASSGRDPIAYEGEEIVVCEKGRLTLRLADEEYVLGAGDSLHFKARIPHSWHNLARSEARFSVTGSLPRKLREAIQQRVTRVARGDGRKTGGARS